MRQPDGHGAADVVDADQVQNARTGVRHRQHAVVRKALHDVLDAALVCHLAVIVDGVPLALPTVFGYDLDEEGHPLSDEQAIKEGGRRREERDEEPTDEQETTEAEEPQPATA